MVNNSMLAKPSARCVYGEHVERLRKGIEELNDPAGSSSAGSKDVLYWTRHSVILGKKLQLLCGYGMCLNCILYCHTNPVHIV